MRSSLSFSRVAAGTTPKPRLRSSSLMILMAVSRSIWRSSLPISMLGEGGGLQVVYAVEERESLGHDSFEAGEVERVRGLGVVHGDVDAVLEAGLVFGVRAASVCVWGCASSHRSPADIKLLHFYLKIWRTSIRMCRAGFTLRWRRSGSSLKVGGALPRRRGGRRQEQKSHALHLRGQRRLHRLRRGQAASFRAPSRFPPDRNPIRVTPPSPSFSRSYILRWFSGVHYDTSKGVKALKDHF